MLFKRKKNYAGKHIVITGGSVGIGLSIAKEFRKRGAHVTVLARNQARLDSAKEQLQKVVPVLDASFEPQIVTISVDVSDFNALKAAIEQVVSIQGLPVDVLVCNAGFAQPGLFHEQDMSVFRSHFEINYIGTVNTIKAVYDGMYKSRSGQICIVSSSLGMMGIVGYSAYAASKHALVGLADSLRSETQGTGIQISLCLPPDTDTPGFKAENASKPEATRIISESGGLYSPDKVAESLVNGMSRGKYIVPCPDFFLGLHFTAVKGFRPRSFPGVLWDMLVGLITPLVYWGWVAWADGVAAKHSQAARL